MHGEHIHDIVEGPAHVFCEEGSVVLDNPPFEPVSVSLIPQLPGARYLRNVCSAAECAQVLLLAEATCMEEEVRGGRLSTAFFVDHELNRSLSERVNRFLPQECFGGNLRGLDRLWVVERCEPGTQSRPGLQPSQQETSLDSTCRLVQNPEFASMGTMLLFLNSVNAGGELRFWIPDERLEDFEHPLVPPEQGSALFFFHGDHPLSLICEDAPVHSGARHVLKCAVVYRLNRDAEKTDAFRQLAEQYPGILRGRQKWERMGWGPIHPGMAGHLNPLGDALQEMFSLFQNQGGALTGCAAELGMGGSPVTIETSGVGLEELAAGGAARPEQDSSLLVDSFTVGELVEAFWKPEGKFYRARVVGIKDRTRIVVDWTDWQGVVAVPAIDVRRCLAVDLPNNATDRADIRAFAIPAEWDTID